MAKVTVFITDAYKRQITHYMRDLADEVLNRQLGQAISESATDMLQKTIRKLVKKASQTAEPSRDILARSYAADILIREERFNVGGRRYKLVKKIDIELAPLENLKGRLPQNTPVREYANYFDEGFKVRKNMRFVPKRASTRNRFKRGDRLGLAIQLQNVLRDDWDDNEMDVAVFRAALENHPRYKAWKKYLRTKFKRSAISGRAGNIQLHHIVPVSQIVRKYGAWVTNLDDPQVWNVWLDENNILPLRDDEHMYLHSKYGWRGERTPNEQQLIIQGKLWKKHQLAAPPGVDPLGFTMHKVAKEKWDKKAGKIVKGPGKMVPCRKQNRHPGFQGSHFMEVFRAKFVRKFKQLIQKRVREIERS